MHDYPNLMTIMRMRGKSRKDCAKAIGCNRTTLYKKLRGQADWRLQECLPAVDESNAIVKVELGESSTDTDAGFLNMVKTDANYLNQFVGKTAPVDEASIDVVAGATVSSKAVVAAVNAAFASQGE